MHRFVLQVPTGLRDFWLCVDKGVLPSRPEPPAATPTGEALDAKLVRDLIHRVGLSEADIAKLTKAEAVQRWRQYLGGGAAN